MRIAVLDLSYWPPEYMWDQPKFGEVLRDWLARGLPGADLPVIDVIEGAPLPAIDDFDGFVISGSADGVYDDPPYMAPLRDFLRAARDAGKPLLGVCFGHQIMADVFGGKAEKVGPPVIGVRQFRIDGQERPARVWHQDQVTRVPPGARVIASADYCPVAGLEYGFPALSVQFHPEYSAEYMVTFLQRSHGKIYTPEVHDAAISDLESNPVEADLFAARAGRFFVQALNEAG